MRSAGRVFIIMVVSAVILFAVVCGALFAFQRSLIYYPQPRSNPEGSILMTLPVGTATVHVSTRPHVGPAALIYFGGNAEASAVARLVKRVNGSVGKRIGKFG